MRPGCSGNFGHSYILKLRVNPINIVKVKVGSKQNDT